MSQGRAAVGSLKVREQEPWGQVQGLSWDELLLPTAPLVASLTGPIRVSEKCRWGERRKKEKAQACSQEGEQALGSLS